jgi:tripartite ATP-independent transporter DctM subunit
MTVLPLTLSRQIWARNVAGGLERVLGHLCAALLVVLLLVVLTAVVMRYGFGDGFVGSEDLAIWLHVALISLGAPLVLSGGLAMRLELFVDRLGAIGKVAAATLADAFVVVSALVLAFGSARIASLLGGTSPTLGLPEWVRFGFLGVGGALVLAMLMLHRLADGRIGGILASLGLGVALFLLASSPLLPRSLPPSAILAGIAGIGLLLAAPLPHVLLAAAYLAIAFGSPLPQQAVVSYTVTGMSKFLLLAVPFFLLVGGLLTASGVARHIVRFASSLVGHRRGGLAQTTLLTSVLFSGASGSSVANAAFGAKTFQPQLVQRGYRPEEAGAIIAATSVLDNVIPPSIAFLILAVATGLSVGSLMLGGFVAGGVMALCLAVAIHLTARETAVAARETGPQRRRAAFAAIPAFGLGVLIVLGIRIGLVTTTEAAALAALYTFGLAMAYRIGAASIWSTIRESAVDASAIGLLIGTAGPFAYLIAVDDISGTIRAAIEALDLGPFGAMLAINLSLLAVGLFLDIGAAILLFGPIFLPVAVAAGVDPVHFGVILVVNLMIGGLTPPVGMLVYVVGGVTRIPAPRLFRAILPYLAALLIALAILTVGALVL